MFMCVFVFSVRNMKFIACFSPFFRMISFCAFPHPHYTTSDQSQQCKLHKQTHIQRRIYAGTSERNSILQWDWNGSHNWSKYICTLKPKHFRMDTPFFWNNLEIIKYCIHECVHSNEDQGTHTFGFSIRPFNF